MPKKVLGTALILISFHEECKVISQHVHIEYSTGKYVQRIQIASYFKLFSSSVNQGTALE